MLISMQNNTIVACLKILQEAMKGVTKGVRVALTRWR